MGSQPNYYAVCCKLSNRHVYHTKFVKPNSGNQWPTQEFCSVGGGGSGGSKNSVEDRGQREWGYGGFLVRGSAQFANE
jgi:hypothetical protein